MRAGGRAVGLSTQHSQLSTDMKDELLFIVGEATAWLYPSSPSGDLVVGSAIWAGACINGLELNARFTEVLIGGTGKAYRKAYHVDEELEIGISRLWVLRRSDFADFRPGFNQRYVLDIVFQIPDGRKEWHRRRFFGVTGRSWDMVSNGVMEFGVKHVYRAERYELESGATVYSGPGTVEVVTGREQFLFTHDGPVVAGDPANAYFLGHYRWPEAKRVVSAKVLGRASQGSETEYTLEVDGVLETAAKVVMPIGGVNTEVSGEATFSGVIVPAGAGVRWRCTAGPTVVEDCAWVVGLVMVVG